MSSLPEIRKLHAITLDELWKEAESLGTIKVDKRTWSNDAQYDVEIVFTRKSGTRVHAKGANPDICFAMATAINEAREMGAGE